MYEYCERNHRNKRFSNIERNEDIDKMCMNITKGTIERKGSQILNVIKISIRCVL